MQQISSSPYLIFYWDAFWVLSNERSEGNSGPLSIKTEAIAAYCDFFGVSSASERLDFYQIIKALDAVFIEFARKMNSQLEQP